MIQTQGNAYLKKDFPQMTFFDNAKIVEAVVRDELGGSVPPRGGPRMLVCYLCGTKHGLSSLLFHQKQCSATREKIQATLLPHERTRAPDPPVVDLPGLNATQSEVETYNQDAQEMYESSLPACSTCGRTFATVESLRKHQRSCKGSHEGEDDDGKQPRGEAAVGGGPRMLVCYMCGTQHGLSSLAIHQRSCELSRQMAQSNLAPSARLEAPS